MWVLNLETDISNIFTMFKNDSELHLDSFKYKCNLGEVAASPARFSVKIFLFFFNF